MKSIVISADLLARLTGEAAASPLREICGLLFGTTDRIEAAEAARNVAEDPATRFEIDPARLIAAHRAQRRGGPVLIGHYHSHPGGRAEPSPRDKAAAEPGMLWLIVAAGTARPWRAGASDFEALDLILG